MRSRRFYELNLMCIFEGQDRTGTIADIKNIIPHIKDNRK
ncbi:MAG: hypothetical protein HDR71_03000 [Lachnospiraceae bacterium]|nr:hypothetical protein [Lachnospiraceae bacterium]